MTQGELVLSEEADWRRFDALAAAIGRGFAGEWVVRLDGLDQRYWDFRLGGALVTLHLDYALGITLFASSDASDPDASARLVRAIAEHLAAHGAA